MNYSLLSRSFILSLLLVVSCNGSMGKLPPIAFPGLSASYRANVQADSREGFKNLKERQECQTDWKDLQKRSSYLYRILAYEALSKCGHPYPEVVVITNNAKDLKACAGPIIAQKKTYRGINFYEEAFKNEAYGVKRLILFHEAVHIVKKDYYANYSFKEESQLREQFADTEGIKLGDCEQCTKEFANYFLQEFFSAQSHVTQVLKVVKKIPKSVEEIYAWNLAYLDWYLKTSKKSLQDLVGRNKSTHPFDLERALYITKIAITTLKSKACEFHLLQLLKQKEQEAQDKKLLEDKKIREAIKKQKEEYDVMMAKQRTAIAALQAKEESLKCKEREALRKTQTAQKREKPLHFYASNDRSAWLFNQKR